MRRGRGRSNGDLNRLLVLFGIAPSNRELLVSRLEKLGWAVLREARGSEALCKQALLTGRDVVVDMDESSSWKNCKHWPAISRSCNAKAIALHFQSCPDSPPSGDMRASPWQADSGFDEVYDAKQVSAMDDFFKSLGSGIQHGKKHRQQRLQEVYLERTPGAGQRQTRRVYESASHYSSRPDSRSPSPHREGRDTYVPWKARSRDPTQTHQRSRSDSQWTRSGRWSEAAVRGQPHCSAERRRPMPSASCPNQEQPDASGSDDSFMTSAPAQALRQSPSPSVQEPEWRQERPFEDRVDRGRQKCSPRAPSPIGAAPELNIDLELGNDLPTVLFDLNGTLTSHTAQRRSAGHNLMRPGISQLRRLLGSFNLGIYTSASLRTVSVVKDMLEEAAGEGPPLFPEQRLILHRVHTIAATPDHITRGGKEWDTRKPLSRYFSRTDRVLLVDDDAFKACEGEESNMVLMPRWEEEAHDTCIDQFVDALLAMTDGMSRETDLRQYSKAVTLSIVKAD